MTVTRLAFPALVLIFAVVIAALTFIDLSGPNTKKQQDLYYPNQHLVPTSIPKPVNEYNEELKTIFYKKITSAEYQAWRQLGGIPRGYQRFPEEQIIKNIRSEIARKVQSEEEITPARIPIVSSPNPLLDGDINKEEWSDALRIDLETKEEPTTLYLKSDGKNLFLACDVPGDKTDHGYDQCRFGFHVDTTHLMKMKDGKIMWFLTGRFIKNHEGFLECTPIANTKPCLILKK